ncbi:MAG: hypothetical protein GY925_13155 [Actinomycetia bacterium]|nr:hypothetical protein [Actinomycetes bacterium]
MSDHRIVPVDVPLPGREWRPLLVQRWDLTDLLNWAGLGLSSCGVGPGDDEAEVFDRLSALVDRTGDDNE